MKSKRERVRKMTKEFFKKSSLHSLLQQHGLSKLFTVKKKCRKTVNQYSAENNIHILDTSLRCESEAAYLLRKNLFSPMTQTLESIG